MLGLEGGPGVRSGWRELQRRVLASGREWTGAIVQPLLPPGSDMLVGTSTTPIWARWAWADSKPASPKRLRFACHQRPTPKPTS
jgi:hypothetical protein